MWRTPIISLAWICFKHLLLKFSKCQEIQGTQVSDPCKRYEAVFEKAIGTIKNFMFLDVGTIVVTNKWPLRHQATLVTRGALNRYGQVNETADMEKGDITMDSLKHMLT